MRSNGFSGDVQASHIDMPFDGSCLFVDNVDSALKCFKDSRATVLSLGLLALPLDPSTVLPPSSLW